MRIGSEELEALIGDAYDDPVAAAHSILRLRTDCNDDEFVAVAGYAADLLLKMKVRLDLAEELAVAIIAIRPTAYNHTFAAVVLEAAGDFGAAAAWRAKALK